MLTTSYHLRVPALWGWIRRGRVRILVYHGISSRDTFDGVENFYGYTIPVSQFERHLLYLKRHCNVLSLNRLLLGEDLSQTKTNVVLTFDDGYENQYHNAYRLLVRYELPAVFALPTRFVHDREPLWDDVVEYAVVRCPKDYVTICWDDENHEFPIATFAGRLALYSWLLRQCVQVDQERRQFLIEAAAEALDVSVASEELFEEDDYRPIGKAQIGEMVGLGLVEFASHSVNHYLLAKCEPGTVRTELKDSKQQLETLTGVPCRSLALPSGSYDSDVLEEAFAAGYQCVMKSDFGPACSDDRVLRRSGVLKEYDLHHVADMVHGPVLGLLGAPRRALTALRAVFT